VRAAEVELRSDIRVTLIYSIALGLSALGCYWFALHVVNPIHRVSATGDTIGALWAAISTVFVYRHSYDESESAALSRVAGTTVSFLLCLVYLLLFPFHLWAIAVLIALGAFLLAIAGRSQDTMPASLATLVVLVISSIDPHNAWQQPILRFLDTVVGVAIGLAAVWVSVALLGRLVQPAAQSGSGATPG
jgi:uncharacterized membrane protein YccC